MMKQELAMKPYGGIYIRVVQTCLMRDTLLFIHSLTLHVLRLAFDSRHTVQSPHTSDAASSQPRSTIQSRGHMHHPLRILLPQLIRLILLARSLLHRRPLRNAINPLQQMRQLLHLLLWHARELPAFHPWPRRYISDTILPLPVTREVIPRLSRVFAGKVDLEDAVDAEGLVAEAVDGVGEFFFGEFAEVVELALAVATLSAFAFSHLQ